MLTPRWTGVIKWSMTLMIGKNNLSYHLVNIPWLFSLTQDQNQAPYPLNISLSVTMFPLVTILGPRHFGYPQKIYKSFWTALTCLNSQSEILIIWYLGLSTCIYLIHCTMWMISCHENNVFLSIFKNSFYIIIDNLPNTISFKGIFQLESFVSTFKEQPICANVHYMHSLLLCGSLMKARAKR